MPDGSGLCSLLALGLAQKSLRKRVYLYYGSSVSPEFTFLPSIGEVAHELDADWDFDTAIILNCPDYTNSGIAAGFGGSGDEKALYFRIPADLPEIKDRIIDQFKSIANDRKVWQSEMHQTEWIESANLTSVLI
jgi:hypothetical protein